MNKKSKIIKVVCFSAVLVSALAITLSFAPKKEAKASQQNIDHYGGTIEKELKSIEDCEITITNGVVNVFYKGEKLVENKDYWVNALEQKFLVQSIEGVDGYLNTYDVVTYYSISGKGDFVGGQNKTTQTKKTLYERYNQ
jgi:hypothetical protein